MVRTQIQITEQQASLVRQAAANAQVSMADIIRRGVDLYLRTRVDVTRESRTQRALAAAGRFRSGNRNVSARHDDYAAEAFSQ